MRTRLRALRGKLRRALPSRGLAPLAVQLAGFAAFESGLALVWVPLALVVGGLLTVLAGYGMAVKR